MEAMILTPPELLTSTGPLSRPGIVDPQALVGIAGITASDNPTDGDGDDGGSSADIAEAQLVIQARRCCRRGRGRCRRAGSQADP